MHGRRSSRFDISLGMDGALNTPRQMCACSGRPIGGRQTGSPDRRPRPTPTSNGSKRLSSPAFSSRQLSSAQRRRVSSCAAVGGHSERSLDKDDCPGIWIGWRELAVSQKPSVASSLASRRSPPPPRAQDEPFYWLGSSNNPGEGPNCSAPSFARSSFVPRLRFDHIYVKLGLVVKDTGFPNAFRILREHIRGRFRSMQKIDCPSNTGYSSLLTHTHIHTAMHRRRGLALIGGRAGPRCQSKPRA